MHVMTLIAIRFDNGDPDMCGLYLIPAETQDGMVIRQDTVLIIQNTRDLGIICVKGNPAVFPDDASVEIDKSCLLYTSDAADD